MRDDAGRITEIFDTAADPRERRNLATDRPQLLTELTGLLETAWSQQAAPPAARPVPHDRATMKRLEALGYLQ